MQNLFALKIINNIFQLLNLLIIIRVLLSWFNFNLNNQFVQILFAITEPILAPFRNLLSSFNMGIDISPMIAIMALNFIRNFLINLII